MIFSLDGAVTKYRDQGTCLIDVPESFDKSRVYPFVVAVHGSNRGAVDYVENPFYSRQREIALEKGCIFGVVSNGYDTWGTDDGLYNLKLFIEYIRQNYPVKDRAVLWATSAGGVLANRLVKEHRELVDRVIGTFPVYDLESTYPLKTCRVAWHSNTFEQFEEMISGKNPAAFSENLKGMRYYLTHGTNDTAVPVEANSLKIKADLGDDVCLEIIEGGIHSTSNFAFYGDAVRKAFEAL